MQKMMMVQAFIANRLDSGNALYYGIADDLMRRLQTIQNPALRQLHWLPVRQCVKFKVATLVHQALSKHAPSYLTDDCCLVTNEDCARQRLVRCSSVGCGNTSATEPVQLDLESRTICRLTLDSLICHTAVSDSHSIHFLFGQ